jgi:hypothetical protein
MDFLSKKLMIINHTNNIFCKKLTINNYLKNYLIKFNQKQFKCLILGF